MVRIGKFTLDKSDIKAALQSMFITMAIVLAYFIGRLASAYETSTIMNYLAGHPEYNISVEGVRIKVIHDKPQFRPEYVMVNGSLEMVDPANWGIWDPTT